MGNIKFFKNKWERIGQTANQDFTLSKEQTLLLELKVFTAKFAQWALGVQVEKM